LDFYYICIILYYISQLCSTKKKKKFFKSYKPVCLFTNSQRTSSSTGGEENILSKNILNVAADHYEISQVFIYIERASQFSSTLYLCNQRIVILILSLFKKDRKRNCVVSHSSSIFNSTAHCQNQNWCFTYMPLGSTQMMSKGCPIYLTVSCNYQRLIYDFIFLFSFSVILGHEPAAQFPFDSKTSFSLCLHLFYKGKKPSQSNHLWCLYLSYECNHICEGLFMKINTEIIHS